MFDIEEAAVLQALIGQYLIRPSAPQLATQYHGVLEHLNDGNVSSDDLVSIKKAIDFFLPLFAGKPEMEAILVSSLLRTTDLIRNAYGIH